MVQRYHLHLLVVSDAGGSTAGVDVYFQQRSVGRDYRVNGGTAWSYCSFFGGQLLIQMGLVFVLAGTLLVAVLHSSGDILIMSFGTWLGYLIAVGGLVGTVGTIYVIQCFSRAIVFLVLGGAIAVIVVVAVAAPTALSASDEGGGTVHSGSAVGLVTDRIASVKSDALDGLVGGCGTHWKVSWGII